MKVNARSPTSTRGQANVGALTFPCALGRSGRLARKQEGDGATPTGSWRLLEVLYRADRIERPRTRLPVRPIRMSDGWCDAIGDRNYNRRVVEPYPASAERLWRADHIYDLIVVLSHNNLPRIRGRGSAIFIHIARPGFTPTEGCVALRLQNLLVLLALVDRRTKLVIG